MSSDDIVTRLREHIPIPLEFADEGAPAHLIAEAADEIERLRAEVARLSSFLHPIGMIIHEQVVSDER